VLGSASDLYGAAASAGAEVLFNGPASLLLYFLYGAAIDSAATSTSADVLRATSGGLVPLGASSTQEALNDGLEPSALQAEAWTASYRTDDLASKEGELSVHVFTRGLRRRFDSLVGPDPLVRRLETNPERR
jgi:hypothetical protein